MMPVRDLARQPLRSHAQQGEPVGGRHRSLRRGPASPGARSSAGPNRSRFLEIQALHRAPAHRTAHAGHAKGRPQEIYEVLRDNPDEAQALLGDLLISVTTFFRDSEAFGHWRKMFCRSCSRRTPTTPSASGFRGVQPGRRPIPLPSLLLEEASRRRIRPQSRCSAPISIQGR